MMMHWIFAHLIGDFLLQPDCLALEKKKSTKHCLAHICIYMLPFLLCGLLWWKFALIAIQHFICDRFDVVGPWTKLVRSQRFLEPPLFPWSYIIIDQTFHILWVAFVVAL